MLRKDKSIRSDDAVGRIVIVVIGELSPTPEQRTEKLAVAVVQGILAYSKIPADMVVDWKMENKRVGLGVDTVGKDSIVFQHRGEGKVAPVWVSAWGGRHEGDLIVSSDEKCGVHHNGRIGNRCRQAVGEVRHVVFPDCHNGGIADVMGGKHTADPHLSSTHRLEGFVSTEQVVGAGGIDVPAFAVDVWCGCRGI